MLSNVCIDKHIVRFKKLLTRQIAANVKLWANELFSFPMEAWHVCGCPEWHFENN